MTAEGEPSLGVFGVSADADRVWQTLLRWPDLGLVALRAKTGFDDGRVEHAVEELRIRGFVEPAPTELGLSAVDPMVSIEHAVAIEQRELAGRLSALSDVRARLPALARVYAQGRQRIDAALPIEVVEGREATQHRLLLLSREARTETLSIDGVQTDAAGRAMSLDDDLAVLGRGVPGRTIVAHETLDVDEETFRYFTTVAAAGEQVRVLNRIPTRMLVFDNEVVVVPLDPADQARGAIFIRVRTIVDMCVFLFERLWNEATPLFVVGPDGAPSGRAARVLELMAGGRKDEAIARSLGVGVRTIRRDVAALMAELGEQTRAAAVAAAIRRGWLSA